MSCKTGFLSILTGRKNSLYDNLSTQIIIVRVCYWTKQCLDTKLRTILCSKGKGQENIKK